MVDGREATMHITPVALTALLLLAAGCGDDSSPADDGATDTPTDGDVGPDADSPDEADADSPDEAEAESGADADADSPDETEAESGADADADADATHPGALGATIRVDHFGWRPGDRKLAAVLEVADAVLELRAVGDASVVGTFTGGPLQADEDSGDDVSVVDFSSWTTPGAYYLYLPSRDERSYEFEIRDDVYRVVGAAAMKSFYFQRCNHARELPYAGDALPGFAGLGGRWLDGACHAGDAAAGPGPGSANHGTLDLHGGWHDAGDYQKTLWGRGVGELLWAWELHPDAWSDGQLGIPESGNGVPDILDELRWELDFYVRMQRPDGHFMTSVKDQGGSSSSPPSSSTAARVYFDCTAPSGDGWSGGGTTIFEATAQATQALAHAALAFRAAGQAATADGYRDAARRGWTWLDGHSPGGDHERELECLAASAVYRLDATQTSARTTVEGFPWATWNGRLPWSVTPGEAALPLAAWHYLANAAGSDTVKSTIRTALGAATVDRAFAEEGIYGGLYGDPSNGWDWGWGSNRNHGMYGANLFAAAHFDALGSRTRAEVEALATKYVHYLLGLNPLQMVYLTNMAAYGGEHSSFQIYHGWFSYTGADGDHGNADYNGRPAAVLEPLYPYQPEDTQTSTWGPAPGLVPGGPNWYYGGSYEIPNRSFPAYAYRDWSVGCDWTGSTCASASWEITEPMCAYQGPVVLLLSFVM